MAQSRIVAEAMRCRHPGLQIELVPIVTRGDRLAGRLEKAGGKGLFTAELERALRAETIDLAVHSAKDLPTAMAGDLVIAGVPPRADPRDALVSRRGVSVSDLPARARVGTGSLRRRVQLLAARGDLDVVPIRGNVDSRLRKILADEPSGRERLDAVVLAMAGLLRSGLADKYAKSIHPLDVVDFVPAAGQGSLAVQARAGNREIIELASGIDDTDAHQALSAERRVLAALAAGCHSCLGVHVLRAGQEWHGYAFAASPDGSRLVRLQVAASDAEQAADKLVSTLRGPDTGSILH